MEGQNRRPLVMLVVLVEELVTSRGRRRRKGGREGESETKLRAFSQKAD